MIYLQLFFTFLKVGAFAFGGGYAMLSLIGDSVLAYGWMTEAELLNFAGVETVIPGPIAVNMATYIGFDQFGVLGGIVTTLALVLPSFIVILIIARAYSGFQNNIYVKRGLYGIRAAVVGLIASAAYTVLTATILTPDKFMASPSFFTFFDFRQLAIFAVIFALYKIFKKHPLWYVLFGAICGIAFL